MRHERAQALRRVCAQPVRVRPHGEARPHPAHCVVHWEQAQGRR